jgi:hypothetical protein
MHIEGISRVFDMDAWKAAPAETEGHYFRIWQRAAVELQKALREWIPESYFRELERFEDRGAAYPVLVYAASRPCFGRPKTEFTYDVADPEMLPAALRSIGRGMRGVLAPMEQRLRAAGRADLAIRYAPVWHQDILRAVTRKPKPLISLLAAEARLVDAVIDLGTTQHAQRFQRTANMSLRNIGGVDMRKLAMPAIEVVTRVLESGWKVTTASCGRGSGGDDCTGSVIQNAWPNEFPRELAEPDRLSGGADYLID